MANLNGAIGAVMGEGYLTKYLDLISFNLSQKVVHFWGKPKDADQIKCAVVQFDIKSGVAASRAIVFDSRAAILFGEGEINLGTEQVDFLLVPKPRRPGLLEFSTKLRISGSILDAKVSLDKLALLGKGARALGPSDCWRRLHISVRMRSIPAKSKASENWGYKALPMNNRSGLCADMLNILGIIKLRFDGAIHETGERKVLSCLLQGFCSNRG